MSMLELVRASGLTASGISQIERTGAFRASAMRALQEALVAKGVIFGANGEVAVRMQWANGRPKDPQVRASVLTILNSARKSRSQAPFEDCGE